MTTKSELGIAFAAFGDDQTEAAPAVVAETAQPTAAEEAEFASAFSAAQAGTSRPAVRATTETFGETELARLTRLVTEQAKMIEQLTAKAAKTPVVDERTTANESRASTKKRIRILVEESQNDGDPEYVDVFVNGRGYRLRRGYEVDVPPEVVEVLDHAIEERMIPLKDSRGMPNGYTVRRMRRVPYRHMGIAMDEKGNKLMGEPLSQFSQE